MQAMPVYIGLLLLILGLIVGFGIRTVFFEAPIVVNPDSNALLKPLRVTVYSSPECPACSEATSLELLLQKRGVVFERVNADISQAPYSAEFEALDANTVPVSTIDSIELKKRDPALFASLGNLFKEKNGLLVFEEIELYKVTLPDFPVPVLFTKLPAGGSCQWNEGDKPLIWEFGDFLCKDCYDSIGPMSQLLADFNNQIEYDFRHFVSFGQDNDSELIANSAECARAQGWFEPYKKTVFEEFFGLRYPTWDGNFQVQAAEKARVPDVNAFKTCIEEKRYQSKVAPRTGTDYSIGSAYRVKQLPAYLIDCRVLVVKPNALEETLCGLHPELSACDAQ